MFRESSIPFRFSLSWKRERETPNGHLGATYDVTKSSLGLGHPIPHLLISPPYSSQRPEVVANSPLHALDRSLARVAGFLRKKQFQIISSFRVLEAIFYTIVCSYNPSWEGSIQMRTLTINDLPNITRKSKVALWQRQSSLSSLHRQSLAQCLTYTEWLISACCRGHTYRLFKKHFRHQIILPVNSFILLITFNEVGK